MKLQTNIEYKAFVEGIKQRVRDLQYAALKAVNKELITLYWDIGKTIVEKQKNLGWGKAIVETLAKDLQKRVSGNQGVLVAESLVYEAVLRRLSGEFNSPTVGWRN